MKIRRWKWLSRTTDRSPWCPSQTWSGPLAPERTRGQYDQAVGKPALVVTLTVAACLSPLASGCGDSTPTAGDTNTPPATSPPATGQTAKTHSHRRRHHQHPRQKRRAHVATARVAYVIDGDTIALAAGPHVRFLQIATPELSSNECYAAQARSLSSRSCRQAHAWPLRRDPALDQIDRYGRLLRYVYLGGTNLNVEMVRRGAAAPYFYDGDRGQFAGRLYSLALTAKRGHRGLWGACPATRLQPSGGSCEPGYAPCLPITSDLDCGQIPDSLKPIHVTGSDPYRLDGDGDGLGCE
jgi:endonuclease YncB( thermonuclease family)